MTPTQQGIVSAPEHINKEDNKEKEEDVVMKNTAEEEKDPFQTTDPWKDEAEPKKSQDKPLEVQDNTEESPPKVIKNEQATDKKTERQP